MNKNVDLQEYSTYQLHLSDWFQQSVIKCTEHFLNIQRRTPSKTNNYHGYNSSESLIYLGNHNTLCQP